MEIEEYQQVLGAHDERITKIVGKLPRLRQIDRCVFDFLLTMLEGQLSCESYIAEETIIATLALYFREFEVAATENESKAAAQGIVDAMNAAGLVKKPDVAASKLDAPMSIGKAYEDNVKRAGMLGMSRVTVNTNDEWTWDTKRDAQKNERKRRKEDEKKAVLRDEYDEFLRRRGIVGEAKVLKLHQKENAAAYSTDIRCEGVHIRMGNNVLLQDADLTLITGHRYGLVGRNGSGKTTLLRQLSEGELEGVSPFVQILHVEQEIIAGTDSPLQVVLSSDIERTNLLREEQDILQSKDDERQGRLVEIYQRLDDIGAHSAEARAAEVLSGLSFTREMMNGPTTRLSGGWRMRVALARALFVEPEVLLLDEPTNHLDLHAVLWLEEFLKGWSRTLVVVSHSRSFLNTVCTEIVHLDNKQLHYYTGNYDMFETTRLATCKQQMKTYESQERDRKHLQQFVDRFRFKASKAAMAQSRLKMIEKLTMAAPVVEMGAEFSFQFPVPEEAPTPYVQIVDCEFGYKAGQTLFSGVNFSLDDESRIALVGANGSGKSTFIKMCMNQLEPGDGQVIRNQKIRIAHFTQHHLEVLTPQQTSVEFMRSRFPLSDDQSLRAHLGSLGLSGDRALQPIYTLSGGQKSRLALALLTFSRPHLLLLDEPTNHLDIDTVAALIEALTCFKGGILVVSHDEHFITSLCDEIYVCGDGKLKKFEGDFADYREEVLKEVKLPR